MATPTSQAHQWSRTWHQPALSIPDDGQDIPASFTCPNCDGDITEMEHESLGICGDCYFAVAEHLQYANECMH